VEDGEIITTPFSYVATTSSILWEGAAPVFVDIDAESLCINPEKIEEAITDKTTAILAVHVYGNICNIERIKEIAQKHDLKVIYDAAHAFGVELNGKTVLSEGDITMCSFHATKVFHTIEGGALIAKDEVVDEKIDNMKRFGHYGDNHITLGINAKASEFQAAMGLANLDYVKENIEKRKHISELYDSLLTAKVEKQKLAEGIKYNYSYYPVIFGSEKTLMNVIKTLENDEVYARRYFYPSLNKIKYIPADRKASCPVSEDIAKRIICLPLYVDIEEDRVRDICNIVNSVVDS